MTVYEAIYNRKSVRRFKIEPLAPKLLNHIERFEKELLRLHPEIGFKFVILDTFDSDMTVRGMFHVKAPYYLVLMVEDKPYAMQEAGYLAEQVVLYMTTKGIGTCYQGNAKADGLEVPAGMKPAMIIAFGMPDGSPYRPESKAKRLELNEICSFKEAVSDDVNTLLRAARMAPSALNTQPWRMVAYGNRIHIFSRKKYGLGYNADLQKFDIGIMLSHIAVAAEELWIQVSLKEMDTVSLKSFSLKNNEYVTTVCLN